MQYIAISRTGVVIAKTSSSYFLGRKIKNFLFINELKSSKLYYYSEPELEGFIKKERNSKYINVRKEKTGKYVYLALSKSKGKRLLIGSSADKLAIEVCKYLKKREPSEVNFRKIEKDIKACKNISNLEILKINSQSKDGRKFECLFGMNSKQKKQIAFELNKML